MSRFAKLSKSRRRRARCKHVLAAIDHRIETLELIREEIFPPVGDFAYEPEEFAVVRWLGLEVYVPLESVVFLGELPPEPEWIRAARTKVEKEVVSMLHSRPKREAR